MVVKCKQKSLWIMFSGNHKHLSESRTVVLYVTYAGVAKSEAKVIRKVVANIFWFD
uniref:Bm13503 n=1 Tax=Brugia malayi TaxID=6279 RepID=A0A0J9XXS6_BRUMA|nr:Bm13503 [Brugia malayi]